MALLEVASGRNMDIPAGRGGNDWNSCWGEESVYQHVVPTIEPGYRVLDLYAGWGRASLPLAFHGGLITLIEQDHSCIDSAKKIYDDAGLSCQLEKAITDDVTKVNLPELGKFDIVIAAYAVTHMLKPNATSFINTLPDLLSEDGGTVVVNAPSKNSWAYEIARDNYPQLALDTYEEECGCSGKMRNEPVPYFLPGEVETVLKRKGGKIIYAKDEENMAGGVSRQVIARFGKK